MEQHIGHAPTFLKKSLNRTSRTQGLVRNVTHHLPPILTLPPDMPLDKLVDSVTGAYKLELETPFWQIKDDPAATTAYSLTLMDIGLRFTNNHNFRAASDIFSLCIQIYSNYYYNYLLAITRFKLGDHQNALTLMETALSQIRAHQILESSLAYLAKDSAFTENFYSFYLSILLFNNQRDRANAIVNFILEKQVITSPAILLSLVHQYRVTDNRKALTALSKKTLEAIAKIPHEELRNQYLTHLREILV